MPVSNVTTALISEYIASRQLKGIQNGTIDRELAILQAMFRLGERSTTTKWPAHGRTIARFPFEVKGRKAAPGLLKDEQFAVLAANAKSLWLRVFIECDYKFGFRKSELLGLRKHQVDLIDGLTVSRAAGTEIAHGRYDRQGAVVDAGARPRQA